jgi:hypothetical protein
LQIAELVCIGADVLAYYETSNNLLLFLLVSLQKNLGLKFETQKRPVSPWYFKSVILVYLVRPERRPKGDLFGTKDLIATSPRFCVSCAGGVLFPEK